MPLSTALLRVYPTAADGATLSYSTQWVYGSWVQLVASTATDINIAGYQVLNSSPSNVFVDIEIGVGSAGSEVPVAAFRYFITGDTNTHRIQQMLPVPVSTISSGSRVAARVRTGIVSPGGNVDFALVYYESFGSNTLDAPTAVPIGADGASVTPSGTAWTNSAYATLTSGITDPISVYGIAMSVHVAEHIEIDLATGAAGSEVVFATLKTNIQNVSDASQFVLRLPRVFPVSGNTRVSWRMRKSGTSTTAHKASLLYYGDSPGIPTVDAGSNQTVITAEGADLDGTVTWSAGAGTTAWTKVSGPGDAVFANASAVDTHVDFTAAGTYVLRLTATVDGLSASDDVTITAGLGSVVSGPVLYVGGVDTPFLVETLDIMRGANARDTLNVEIYDANIASTPNQGVDIVVEIDGVREFGGILDRPTYRGFGDIGWAQMNTLLKATDFNLLLDRRVLTTTIPAGSMESQLQYLIDLYLGVFGVTLHPDQVTGPTMPAMPPSFDGPLSEQLKAMATAAGAIDSTSGWIFEIDYFKRLRMWEPGTVLAPFDIEDDDGHVIGDMQVEYLHPHANRVILLAGGEGLGPIVTEEFEIDPGGDVNHQFETKYFADDNYNGMWPNEVIINDVVEQPADWFLHYLTSGGGGLEPWYWDHNTHSMYYDTTIGNPSGYTPIAGDTLKVTYQTRYPLIVIRKDDPDIAINGPIDIIVRRDDIKSVEVAEPVADEELAAALENPRTISFMTETWGLAPGQEITVDSPIRGIDNADFLITDVRTTNDESNAVRYYITAIEGTRLRYTWRDILRRWDGQ